MCFVERFETLKNCRFLIPKSGVSAIPPRAPLTKLAPRAPESQAAFAA